MADHYRRLARINADRMAEAKARTMTEAISDLTGDRPGRDPGDAVLAARILLGFAEQINENRDDAKQDAQDALVTAANLMLFAAGAWR